MLKQKPFASSVLSPKFRYLYFVHFSYYDATLEDSSILCMWTTRFRHRPADVWRHYREIQ